MLRVSVLAAATLAFTATAALAAVAPTTLAALKALNPDFTSASVHGSTLRIAATVGRDATQDGADPVSLAGADLEMIASALQPGASTPLARVRTVEVAFSNWGSAHAEPLMTLSFRRADLVRADTHDLQFVGMLNLATRVTPAGAAGRRAIARWCRSMAVEKPRFCKLAR